MAARPLQGKTKNRCVATRTHAVDRFAQMVWPRARALFRISPPLPGRTCRACEGTRRIARDRERPRRDADNRHARGRSQPCCRHARDADAEEEIAAKLN